MATVENCLFTAAKGLMVGISKVKKYTKNEVPDKK
jgi:hypothetical protein